MIGLQGVCAEKSSAILEEEFIYSAAPFLSCHASTLTETRSGKLLCAWFGGEAEGRPDVKIWFSDLSEKRWSTPEMIARVESVPAWNPVLFTLPQGEVLLFYKGGPHPTSWSGYLKRSMDDGKSWSTPELLPAGVFGPVKNKPILLKDGTLLCGSSTESWGCWGCWVDITQDGGRTWKKSDPINLPDQPFGIIQPTLFLTGEGKVKLLARSHQVGYIVSAESSDGVEWSRAVATQLPNPNSGIDAVRLKSGTILLVYNRSKEARYPLNVALSKDDGTTWEDLLVLESRPGEYSYPAVIQTDDEKVHITYTWNRKKIKHVVLDPKSL